MKFLWNPACCAMLYNVRASSFSDASGAIAFEKEYSGMKSSKWNISGCESAVFLQCIKWGFSLQSSRSC